MNILFLHFSAFRQHLIETCRLLLPLSLLGLVASSTLAVPDTRGTDVLNALDLTQPELSIVAKAMQVNDQPAALKAFASYLRNRTNVHWRENPDGSEKTPLRFSQAVADAAVEGRVKGGLVAPIYPFPKGEIDWHFNATEHTPELAPNNEWMLQLNRMEFWKDMAGAYAATGDERYALAFVRQFRSWIAQCPVPDHAENGGDSTWRTIEAGIRAGWNWPDVFLTFLHSPSLNDDDLIAMVASFLDHGRYLRANQTRFNWLTMEMSGLYTVGTLLPEFREAAEWRTYSENRMIEEAKRQFLPDGAQVELSTGYQNVAIDNTLQIAKVARWNGRETELSPSYVGTLEKGYDWQMALLAPTRVPPKFNDSWENGGVFQRAVQFYPKREDFRWFATDGKEGTAPAWTSTFQNRSGFAAMRSGWDREANYLVFRVGPAGAGHQHQDGLNVLLWPYGRELLFNNSGGSYEKSKWRDWAVSTFSHNCVIVDGLAQTRTFQGNDPLRDPNRVSQGPIDAHWLSTPVFDYATGVYDQTYGPEHLRPAVQRRDVLFLKPDLFIVADRLTPADNQTPHRYQARWQLLTTQTRIDPATHTLVTEDPGLPNLAIVPLLADDLDVTAASAQEEPEILGWNVRKDKVPQNIPSTTLLHTRTGTGPQTLLTLLIPLRPGQPHSVVKVEPETDGRSITIIFTNRARLQISCAGEQGISVRETLPDGTTGRTAQANTH